MSIRNIWLCGIGLIVLAGAIIALIFLPKGRAELVGIKCRDNIQRLGFSLIQYADDNGGMLPDKDSPEGILMAGPYFKKDDLSILFCPAKSTYCYLGGLTYEFKLDYPRVPLVWDEGFPHTGKKAVCFMDGKSGLLDEKQWEEVKPITLKKNFLKK